MKFRFPVLIIDEDFRSENTSGLGIRALAEAMEGEGAEVGGLALGALGVGGLAAAKEGELGEQSLVAKRSLAEEGGPDAATEVDRDRQRQVLRVRDVGGLEILVGGVDVDVGVGELERALGRAGAEDAAPRLGVALLGAVERGLDVGPREPRREGGRLHPREEGPLDPAVVLDRDVPLDRQVAASDPIGRPLVDVDVEIGLVVGAAADKGQAGVAAEIAAIEEEAIEAGELVALPLLAGEVVGVADRRELVAADVRRLDAAAVGEGAGAGVDAQLALDVALGEGDAVVDPDPTDAPAR